MEEIEKDKLIKITKQISWMLSVFLILCLFAYFVVFAGLRTDMDNCREAYVDCATKYNTECAASTNPLDGYNITFLEGEDGILSHDN